MVVFSEVGTALVYRNSYLVGAGTDLETDNMARRRKAKSRHGDKSTVRSKTALTGIDPQQEEEDRMAAALAMSALANGSVGRGRQDTHNHESGESVSTKVGQVIMRPFNSSKTSDPPMEFKVNLPKRNKDAVKRKVSHREGVPAEHQISDSCGVGQGKAAKSVDSSQLVPNGDLLLVNGLHVNGISNLSNMAPVSGNGGSQSAEADHDGHGNKLGGKRSEDPNKQAHLPPKKRRIAGATSGLQITSAQITPIPATNLTLSVTPVSQDKLVKNSGHGHGTAKPEKVTAITPPVTINHPQGVTKVEPVTIIHNISANKTAKNRGLVVSDSMVMSRDSGVLSVVNDSSKLAAPSSGSFISPARTVKLTESALPTASVASSVPQHMVNGVCPPAQIKEEQAETKGKMSPVPSSSSMSRVEPTTTSESAQMHMPIADPQRSLMMLAECQMAMRADEDGDLPLHIAAVQGDMGAARTLVRLMVASRVTIDPCNKLRQTPLHLAVITDQPDMVHLLLSAGATPNIPDRHGNTSLHLAARNRCKECMKVLLHQSRTKVHLNAKNYEGFAPLHLAVQVRESAIVTALVNASADLDVQDGKSGRTPLYHACETNQHHLVEILLKHGSNVNLQSYAGATPLHAASGRSYMDIVALLVRFGADTTVKNANVDFFFTTRADKKGSKSSQKGSGSAAASSVAKSSPSAAKVPIDKLTDGPVVPSGSSACTQMQSRLMTTGGTVTVVSSAATGQTNLAMPSITTQPLQLSPQIVTSSGERPKLMAAPSSPSIIGQLQAKAAESGSSVSLRCLNVGSPVIGTPLHLLKERIPPLPWMNVAKAKPTTLSNREANDLKKKEKEGESR